MTMLNRCAVLVRPRQPYLEWMGTDDADGTAQEAFNDMYEDPVVFLYEDDKGERQPRSAIADFWPAIFEQMLSGWGEDRSSWPSDRTRRMFDQWFDCDFASEVTDLGSAGLHFDD